MYYIKADKIEIIDNEIFLELNQIGYKGICFDKETKNKKFFLYQLKSDYTDINYFSNDKQIIDLIRYLHKLSGIGETIVKQLLSSYSYEDLKEDVKKYNINSFLDKTPLKLMTVELLIDELNKYFFNIKKTTKDKKVIETLKKLGYQTNQIYTAIQKVDKINSIDEYIKNIIINISLNET
ncbi:Holliday junction DNA helicase RuvA [Spiroplasma sp. TIUS-1]|uniref:hypothetical protein n=1 Tax=Spiroplasma sp. TIUS-1 TaxID=216963 RepID=UPI001399491E|nr:hypothetical protein [Spiroplasma sp. TIUS-1]QHX35908.1 Holliday junction DNA helicase RuvA [Spiroplasma sp. TIUS-1]